MHHKLLHDTCHSRWCIHVPLPQTLQTNKTKHNTLQFLLCKWLANVIITSNVCIISCFKILLIQSSVSMSLFLRLYNKHEITLYTVVPITDLKLIPTLIMQWTLDIPHLVILRTEINSPIKYTCFMWYKFLWNVLVTV